MKYALRGRGERTAFFVCTLHITHKHPSTSISIFYSHFLSASTCKDCKRIFSANHIVNGPKEQQQPATRLQ